MERARAAVAARAAEKPPPTTAPPPPWRVVRPRGGPPPGITAADLFVKEFPPTQFVVDGLIGAGMTVLGGRPKGGKSWLALLAGWAVAAGYQLDDRQVWQGEVLYLALEDQEHRLKGRLHKLHSDLGWVVPETLTINTSWPNAGDGGLFHIADWLEARKGVARLVIVDILTKFRRPQKGGGNSYADDYEAVGGLKELVDHYGASAVFIHHTRKLKAEDPFDELSGTYGISGPADTLAILDADGGGGARLYVRGRDLPESTTQLTYTRASGRWVLGATQEGIDVAARGAATPGGPAAGRAETARQWLRSFLKEYAYPAREVDKAGRAMGLTPNAIATAKTELKGLGEVKFRKDGADCWWVGLGEPATWKRRPEVSEPIPD